MPRGPDASTRTLDLVFGLGVKELVGISEGDMAKILTAREIAEFAEKQRYMFMRDVVEAEYCDRSHAGKAHAYTVW